MMNVHRLKLRNITHISLLLVSVGAAASNADKPELNNTNSNASHNNSLLSAFEFNDLSRVVTVSVGPAWASPGKRQVLVLQPEIQKTYVPTNATSTLGYGEIFLGMERLFASSMKGQFGFAVAGATNANLYGDVWEDSNPKYNNYLYRYNVNHTHFALKGKVLKAFESSSYEPYLSGSVGVGFNHAYDFNVTPKIYEEVAPPLFKANTTTAFTYTVGAGVQKRMTSNWLVGLGYEFADWGASHLAKANGQTSGNGLALNHLYTNGLLLSITYQPQGANHATK